MNNQDTMNENKEQETKTRVLSDTERRDFDGVTIDEAGDNKGSLLSRAVCKLSTLSIV